MQQVDEQPMETIHLYVVREEATRPSLLPIFFSVFTLLCVVAVGVLSPYKQPEIRAILRVPAILLTPKLFSASETIISTGIKTIPATIAHGYLTITNGSVIAQVIPKGFTIEGVTTDSAVFVPAGSANGYGVVTVSAHTVVSGKSGNIPALAINRVEGSSIYIRNLTSFQGGKDSYSIPLQLPQDRQTALEYARQRLLQQSAGLHYPCRENHFVGADKMIVTWQCQFVSYHIPAFYHVTGVVILGKNLLVSVWFIARPLRIETK